MTPKQRLKKILKNLYWGIRGVFLRNPDLPANPSSFLFICQGNICRGPFASGLAERMFHAKEPVRCGSAGLHVLKQSPSPREAVEAAGRFGVNLGDHLSRSIDSDMLEKYDMILVMEAGQLLHLRKTFPEVRDKIFLLPLFDAASQRGMGWDRMYNIEDPYGKSVDEFMTCYRRIANCLEGLFGGNRK